MPKDNFSAQANAYAAFRPLFPAELYHFIAAQTDSHDLAWDVATGNGQSAVQLRSLFKRVVATDISRAQLDHAQQHEEIEYRQEAAESSSLNDSSADLINVSQALHWFNFSRFYDEVRRVAKPHAVIAAYAYSMFTAGDNAIDSIVQQFYFDSTKYWDEERRYVDEEYKTIPFPFEEIPAPAFSIEGVWTLDDLLGYLSTWSACQHYIKMHGQSMISHQFVTELANNWPASGTVNIRFPVHMRIGRV